MVFHALKYPFKLAVFPLVKSVAVIKVIKIIKVIKVINISVYKSTRALTDPGYTVIADIKTPIKTNLTQLIAWPKFVCTIDILLLNRILYSLVNFLVLASDVLH